MLRIHHTFRSWSVPLITALSALFILTASGDVPVHNDYEHLRPTKYLEGSRAMVSTSHPEASRIALDMLAQGGNAVDAAIAAAYAIGVFEPTGSGIGGGGTAVIYIASEDRFYNLDFYPRSPANPNLDYNPATDASTVKAVSVPLFVSGMEELRERWALLDRSAHILPSVPFAREGIVPDSVVRNTINAANEKAVLYEESRRIFTDDGARIGAGFVVKNPGLAQIMEQVADGGREAFYNSEFTVSTIEKLNALGGQFTMEDFQDVDPVWRDPVLSTYRGYDVISVAPPQAGLLILQSLNMMETFDFQQSGHYTQSPESLHFLFEMFKRSFADRLSFLGDPRFVDVPIDGMTSKAYARNRVGSINMAVAEPRRLRDTEPGNPFAFRGALGQGDTGMQAPGYIPLTEPWDDHIDDEASSYDWWGDDMFDSWGAPRKERQNRRNLLDWLLGRQRADTTRIEPTQFEDEDEWYIERTTGSNTSHISVIDEDGNMVSMTSTIGLFLGAGITVNGVVMNSGQANFGSTNPVNVMAGGRTPRSTIAPTIVMDQGRPKLIIGAAGGARIPPAIILTIHNILDFDMDGFQASTAPRFLSRRWADYIEIEGHMPERLVEQMRRRGHPVQVRDSLHSYFGGMNVIHIREDGTIEGVSDPRRDGSPAGW